MAKRKQSDNIFPTILNLFYCGLGQLIQGRVGLGIGLMLTYATSIAMCLLLIGFITTPIIWIWALYDCYTYEVE